MEIRKIEDRGGEVLVSKHFDGINFPPNVPGNVKDHLEAIRKVKYKEGDVFLGTFPKCGTHWGFDVLYMLQKGKAEYNIGKISPLDFDPADAIDILESPRVLVSHFYPQHIPQSLIDEKCKMVYIYRNPKDATVSMQSFIKRLQIRDLKPYNGTWEHYFELFIAKDLQYNSWFEHVKSWLDFRKTHPDIPMLFMSFEDMKQDLRSCVQEMAIFLGAKQDPEFLDEVANKCQFSAMSKAKSSNKDETLYSTDGSNPFYRKGEVGDWKNWFTVAQNEMFDKVFGEKMENIDLEIKYTI